MRTANLFDPMRLVAAAMVIIGHAWPLTGLSGVPVFAGIRIHHLGVYVFFAISGYLLATSWERDPRTVPFLLRRCLRIFPALIVVVALTVFVIGPIATSLPQEVYWSSGDTWRYLLSAVLLAQYELPGVFDAHPETAVNGSLWSLGVEFCCYLMLVATALLGPRMRLVVRGALALLLGIAVLHGSLAGPLRTTAVAVVFFVLGSFAARGGDPRRWPVWPAVVAMAGIAGLQGGVGTLLAWPVVVYTVVAVGSRGSRVARAVRRLGDPSYGMYLWGYPVQQGLVALAGPLPLVLDIAAVLLISLALGYGSWHLIERRAIALGGRMSARTAPRNAPVSHETHSPFH